MKLLLNDKNEEQQQTQRSEVHDVHINFVGRRQKGTERERERKRVEKPHRMSTLCAHIALHCRNSVVFVFDVIRIVKIYIYIHRTR